MREAVQTLAQRGEKVCHYVQSVLQKTSTQHSLKIGPLDAWAARELSRILSLEIDPTDEFVLADSVIHASKRHADLCLQDWQQLPLITNQFDAIAQGAPARNPALIRLIFKKTIGSDCYGAVAELAGLSRMHKRLNLLTFFKGSAQSLDAWWQANAQKNKEVDRASVSIYTKLVQKTPSADTTSSPRRITQSSLFDQFEQTALRHADKSALIFKDQTISYGALLALVLAKAIEQEAAWGLGSGARIPYVGLNSPDAIATLLACAKVGAIYVPINHRLADAEIAAIFADARVLAPPALRVDPPVPQGGTGQLDITGGVGGTGLPLRSRGNVHASEQRGLAPSQPCLLVYTSGTTGQPKGAVHTQAGLLANARAAWAAHEMTADDVILSTLPMFHVGGLCIQTLPALLLGATVVLHDRFDAAAWLADVARNRVTLSLVVPATMKAIQDSPTFASSDLSSLRGVMAGSSTIPLHLIEAFHARGIPVGQIYGTTETGPVSAVLPFAKALSHAGFAGWPHDHCKIELHHPNEQGVGEVVIEANNLMAGYWGALNLTKQLGSDPNLMHDPTEEKQLGSDPNSIGLRAFNTGDLGRIHADGCLEIVGRAKDMLISGGENIYPAEIENALLAHPAVEECAVVGEPDPRWGEIPVAYVVVKNGLQTASDKDLTNELLAHLKLRIAKFKFPKRFVFLDALPKSALGKVLKGQLK